MISKRQFELLKKLYNTEGFVTTAEIARQLGVSVKTVRNDLTNLNVYLTEHDNGEIETKAHSGVRLTTTPEHWQSIIGINTVYEQEENEALLFQVICQLLKRQELNAQRFAEDKFISRVLLDKLLEQVRQWFSAEHIFLERRRGKGVRITYTEYNYRLAFLSFFNQFKSYLNQGDVRHTSRLLSVSQISYSQLTELFDGFDTDPVSESLASLEEKYGFRYSYTGNTQLLVLLSLCITRSRKNIQIDVPKPIRCKIDGAFNRLLHQDLTAMLEERYEMKFSENELKFLYFALSISEIQEFADEQSRRFAEYHDIELCRFTVKFARLFSEITNVDLINDRFFVQQMYMQFKPMISRLQYCVGFKNPLLKQIKAKYPNMMAIAWAAGNLFDKELGLDINEHEAAFLALHIGGALERKSVVLSACIVCEYGVGISQLLREKIERMIPELHISEVYSNRDIRKIKSDPCDFIISTTPLDGLRIEKTVVTVEHLISSDNIRQIENSMKQARKRLISKKESLTNHTFSQFLFNKELIYLDLTTSDKTTLLKQMCARMEQLGYVTEEFEKSVLDREKHTSTEVGKGIALPHGYSEYVNRSIVAVANLNQPILWFENSEEVNLVFLLAFDMNQDNEMKNEIVRFYKSFVTFMENNEMLEKAKSYTESEQWLEMFRQW